MAAAAHARKEVMSEDCVESRVEKTTRAMALPGALFAYNLVIFTPLLEGMYEGPFRTI